MEKFELALQISNGIRSLAIKAVKELSASQSAYHVARRRSICPVDYIRFAEFDATLAELEIVPHMKILDVSSPQWFSLYLADKNPDAEFHYINIIDTELDPYKEIANVLGIRNLKYEKIDVRGMPFNDNTFDKVITISVIEHIYPEENGDLKALSEIKRVLKPHSDLLLTIPYKAKGNIVYIDGPVYERSEKARNFFAREYDKETFDKLIEASGFSLEGSWFICERRGIFPVDYYEWGPGKDILFAKYLIKSKRLLERILGKTLDEVLARQYLIVSREVTDRLVNILAKLRKA